MQDHRPLPAVLPSGHQVLLAMDAPRHLAPLAAMELGARLLAAGLGAALGIGLLEDGEADLAAGFAEMADNLAERRLLGETPMPQA